ncbi:MAG: hypothetical protein ACOCV8_05925, partial [Spirochaetota bacterium]
TTIFYYFLLRKLELIITLGTFEERIDEMIKNKQKLSDSIVKAGENWITEMNNEQLKEIFNL